MDTKAGTYWNGLKEELRILTDLMCLTSADVEGLSSAVVSLLLSFEARASSANGNCHLKLKEDMQDEQKPTILLPDLLRVRA